ncbi:MAG: tRNA threonylcarbamoyladenosine dehydratase [Verrucomicrobia bacterium]|nr:tRNA threonylcarbamoyladenosine dehydratase [Verrucomicrobiota bacterium]
MSAMSAVSDGPSRFGGVARLFGAPALAQLQQAHVLVVGLGGVGSWSVEGLARTGVGALTLVDLDEICVTNINRQLPALDSTLGQAKAEVLADRVRSINPECRVAVALEFFTEASAERLLRPAEGQPPFSAVLDAMDSTLNKIRLIARCRDLGLPLVCCGAAGGRRDAARVSVADLSQVTHDRLLGGVRKQLRRDLGFPRTGPLGVDCVFSPEPPVFPQPDGTVCGTAAPMTDGTGEGEAPRLNCNQGLGSSVFVTGTFGFVAAGRLVDRILRGGVGG